MKLEQFKYTLMPLREKLLYVAHNMLHNAEDAEDAVQETYLKMWSIRDQLENYANIEGFVMQSLKNNCIDKIRTSKINVDLEFVSEPDEKQNPYSKTEQQDNILNTILNRK